MITTKQQRTVMVCTPEMRMMNEPNWVSVNGKLVRLHDMDDECVRIYASLNASDPLTWRPTLSKMVGRCLPDLPQAEVDALSDEQILAVVPLMLKMAAARIAKPQPPER